MGKQDNKTGNDQYESLKLCNQLCFPLYAASRKITSIYTPYFKPLGLTYTKYIVFLVLWEEDGITVGDICSRLYLDNGTVTPLIKKMEAEGYVTRKRSKEDERVTLICITQKGDELKEACKDIPQKVAATCGHLDGEDAKTLYRILYQLLEQ